MSQSDLPTQAGVDLEKYAGTWYEQARLPNRFQKDCVGDIRAHYALETGGTLSVTNQCRRRDGRIEVAHGQGRRSSAATPSDPAKLEVRFAPSWTSWLPMVWGDYWILKIEGDYQYSLVGTPDRKYLWVLSRHEQSDEASVQALLDYAGTLGFPIHNVLRSAR